MTVATIAPATPTGRFLVTDAMYAEVTQILKFTPWATHAVIYQSSPASGGWDFEPCNTAAGARHLARKIGNGAEVMPL